ncbi:hypothetical protein FBUS_08534 [Fasciolopsis buskii]|uniref:Tetraspanin n=1 Tax=Fasciolopsis buskii TaxID=27845 RepID=A0A8E0VNU0_9TREM|nr:hypothetical protein FBUS_08534 [Fasciolopsis buski]
MSSPNLKRRISTLPVCHALLVIILFISGALCLTLDIAVLSEKICNCPVINNNFVPFWVHAAVSILQLCLALFMLVTLITLGCRSVKNTQSMHLRFIRDHLVGAVGSTGQFIPIYTDTHPPLISDWEENRLALIRMTETDEICDCCGKTCPILHCARRRNCTTRIGWLQPITLILVLILIGQTVILIWFCQQRSELTDPHTFFFSRVTNLFVEVKIDHLLRMVNRTIDSVQTTDGQISRFLYPNGDYCWSLIQNLFHCCGPSRYTDWAWNSTMNESSVDFLNILPESCFCPSNPSGDQICKLQTAKYTSRGMLYTGGCLQPLAENLHGSYTVGMIIIPCSLSLLLLAFLCDLVYTLRTAKLVIQVQEEEYLNTRRKGDSGLEGFS